jgi:phenylalanyl-tRNA synthetase beta chain
VRTGGTGLHWRGEKPYDIFSVKADLMAVLANLGVNVEGVQLSRAVPSYYHPHAAGRVSLGAKNTLGFFGELHPAILRSFGIESKVFAFECWLDNVPTPKTKRKANYSVSEFQASKRDFAFIAEANLPAGELQLAIKKAGGALVKSVELFDLYQGDNMQAGKKSLGYNVTLQAPDRTLQEADIVEVCNNIIAAAEKMGAILR